MNETNNMILKSKIIILIYFLIAITFVNSTAQSSPTLLFNTQKAKTNVTFEELIIADSIIVNNTIYQIKSFHLSVLTGPKFNDLILLKMNGDKLSPEAKEILENLKYHGKLLFEHITLIDKNTGKIVDVSPFQIDIKD